jgi:hypothetical protein
MSLEDSQNSLIYQTIISPESDKSYDFADRIWIHKNGTIASVIDGVSGCKSPSLAADFCKNYLQNISLKELTENISEHLQKLHLLLKSEELQAVIGIIFYNDKKIRCLYVGNPRLYQFNDESVESLLGEPEIHPLQVLGMSGDVTPLEIELNISDESTYILSTDGLKHDSVQKNRELFTCFTPRI